jgi:hypothetical protein
MEITSSAMYARPCSKGRTNPRLVEIRALARKRCLDLKQLVSPTRPRLRRAFRNEIVSARLEATGRGLPSLPYPVDSLPQAKGPESESLFDFAWREAKACFGLDWAPSHECVDHTDDLLLEGLAAPKVNELCLAVEQK